MVTEKISTITANHLFYNRNLNTRGLQKKGILYSGEISQIRSEQTSNKLMSACCNTSSIPFQNNQKSKTSLKKIKLEDCFTLANVNMAGF